MQHIYWYTKLRSNETQATEPKESLDTKALVALFMEDRRLVGGLEAAISQIWREALPDLSPTSIFLQYQAGQITTAMQIFVQSLLICTLSNLAKPYSNLCTQIETCTGQNLAPWQPPQPASSDQDYA